MSCNADQMIFGAPSTRVHAIAAEHVGALAMMHGGALFALAEDEAVSPAEMFAVVKFQLVAGLMSIIETEVSGGGDRGMLVAELMAYLAQQLTEAVHG